MRFRALAALPVVLVVLALLGYFLAPPAAQPRVLTGAVEAAKILAIAGCTLAALAFEGGDYLRRAWLLLAACTSLLLARDVVALFGGAAALQGALALGGNGCSVAGTWMLARAWTVAGLDDGEDSSAGRMVILAGAAGLAVLVTGAPLVGDVAALLRGEVFAFVPLASDVADAVVLVLLAPLLQTTLALRGGVLRWPWAMLTCNNLLWLVFDAVYGFGGAWHVEPAHRHLVTEALRALATAYTFSAGIAQRWAVTSTLEGQPAS
ncbi:MAG: hypothetical protein ACRELB_26690 [Polyangiaceae bacterium]